MFKSSGPVLVIIKKPLTEKKLILHSVAIHLASKVFPVPFNKNHYVIFN